MGKKLDPGDPAPDFKLPVDSGGLKTLKSFAGEKLVLYFYPKDNTPGCTKEAIDFNALKSAFAKARTTIVGVSPDSIASHAKFKAKHKLDLELISDESKVVLEAYGVWTEKSLYGHKYMGVARTTFLIAPNGKIAQVWHNVKVAGHAAAVLTAAEALT